jgi:hypothetical protein
LFEFNAVSKKHPNARLDHAFRLAQEKLGIERLLDPEGVIFFDVMDVYLTYLFNFFLQIYY